MAFGPLGLSPAEFGVLTPAELGELHDGWVWRQDFERRSRARDLSVLLSVLTHGKRSPKAWFEALIGDGRQQDTEEQARRRAVKAEHERLAREARKKRERLKKEQLEREEATRSA